MTLRSCCLGSIFLLSLLVQIQNLYAQPIPFAFWRYDSSAGSCSGQSVGGYCWFLGTSNQSCDTVCSNQGSSCDLTGTRDYAGTGGSDANCLSVLTALSIGSGGIASNSGTSSMGCIYHGSSGERRRVTNGTTTCSAQYSFGYQRACACAPSGPDYTPDSIDWANFNNSSSSEAITGINQTINLQLSVVYGTGTPTVQYNKNSTGWTTFTPGSPASVSFVNLDTLQFQVTGTDTHSATITVTNLSDSSTVIDTTTGTIAPCTGQSVGGYCWFLGSGGQSCDTVCSNQGSTCNLGGTRDYAGSGGSDANCLSVLTALSIGSGGISSNSGPSGLGCIYYSSLGQRRRISSTTTCSDQFTSSFRRACACN